MKALIFDLDGTLIDSVYAHTLAWQRALKEVGIETPAWEIHRRIGISGKLLAKSIAREQERTLSDALIEKAEGRHSAIFREITPSASPLPGACDLLRFLHRAQIPHGIATSGKRVEIGDSLKALAVGSDVIVIAGDSVERAKPDPDLFLQCQHELGIAPSECLVVGDAVWDVHSARRAGISAVGVLTGGFGEQELYNAGAMRVYAGARELHRALDELGFTSL
ncbi:MAG: HAD family hydrolase [Pseudomonadota bacterium]|nr:HAD family hydrolase [Pseudomonadota bacterium]